jgi:hypothetical protein
MSANSQSPPSADAAQLDATGDISDLESDDAREAAAPLPRTALLLGSAFGASVGLFGALYLLLR